MVVELVEDIQDLGCGLRLVIGYQILLLDVVHGMENCSKPDCLSPTCRQSPAPRKFNNYIPSPLPALCMAPCCARTRQCGFDGYLLNFECPLQGGVEHDKDLPKAKSKICMSEA